MDPDLKEKADALFEQAVRARGARDPRDFFRERLRELKARDAEAYRRAVARYEEELIPSIASGEAEPLAAWQEYGRFLAELTAPGRTVEIDPAGRARDYDPPAPDDRLVLHLPDSRKLKALLVALPPALSPAQKATYDLLVAGKTRLESADG